MAITGWRDRLAATSVLRTMPGWRGRVRADADGREMASPLPERWREEAAEQLHDLVSAGIAVDTER